MAVWQVAIIFNLMCYSNTTASYQKPPLSTSIYIYIYIYIYIHLSIYIYIDDPTCVRSLGVAIWPHLHPSISTALMRPRRPKQYCLQLVIYIYIYMYLDRCLFLFLFFLILERKEEEEPLADSENYL